MLMVRYFIYVGGVLLALLFVSDAYLPKSPVVQTADTDLPVIRIHSDRKWPERIVFDTSRPTIVAAPAPVQAVAAVQPPASAAEISAKARVRETFAQFVPPEAKKPAPKPQRKRIAQRRAAPPIMLVAQQPQFGLFGNNPWRSTW